MLVLSTDCTSGLPLGKGLTGWRKIVIGNRNWRIIFTVNDAKTVATVWVIGDGSDHACYAEATKRVQELAKDKPYTISLAALIVEIMEMQRQHKRPNRLSH